MAWKPEDQSYLEKTGLLKSRQNNSDYVLTKESLDLYHKHSSQESTKIIPVHQHLVNK
jgi:hypothetical protein